MQFLPYCKTKFDLIQYKSRKGKRTASENAVPLLLCRTKTNSDASASVPMRVCLSYGCRYGSCLYRGHSVFTQVITVSAIRSPMKLLPTRSAPSAKSDVAGSERCSAASLLPQSFYVTGLSVITPTQRYICRPRGLREKLFIVTVIGVRTAFGGQLSVGRYSGTNAVKKSFSDERRAAYRNRDLSCKHHGKFIRGVTARSGMR